MRVVGLLLIASLLLIPVAGGSRLAHSFRDTVRRAILVGVFSCLAGLVITLALGEIPPGGTFVLTSIAAFVAATVVGRRAAQRHPRVAR